MTKKKLPKSLRKHIRSQKARLKREVFNLNKREELIEGLYKKFLKDNIKPEMKK